MFDCAMTMHPGESLTIPSQRFTTGRPTFHLASEMFPHLADGLARNFAQTFMMNNELLLLVV